MPLADPFCINRGDKSEAKGFGAASKAAKPAPLQVKRAPQGDRKWQLQPYDVREWLQWMAAQQELAQVKAGRCLVQIDAQARLKVT